MWIRSNRPGASRGRAGTLPALGLVALLAFAPAACQEAGLSDEAWAWCNAAPDDSLAAAARALNIQPDQELQMERNPDDPAFQRVCEYAYEARDREFDVPPGVDGPPIDPTPVAPPDPHASPDAPGTPPPAAP
jgi:hypothetical protein